jgi:uridine kinase
MIWEGRLKMNDKAIIIGIAGGSASGKTSIAAKVYEAFEEKHQVVIIKQDDYYKDQSDLPMEERVKTNYDHPLAFDTDLLVKHLKMLKQKVAIEKPTYDYTQHTRSNITEVIEGKDVLILEGIFVLAEEEVRKQCDILVYVDTDGDIRFIRRLRRDMEERGRSLDSVCEQYLHTVRPMHEQFIEPSKKYAHIIIPNGGSNVVAIDLLITKIRSIIE